MAMMDEIWRLDATAQADLVRRGDVTAMELVDAAIERIERLNPELNAVVTPVYDLARKAVKDGLPEGPFTGVPFLLKDLGPFLAGVRQTAGSAFLKDFIPDHDSELVKRYKRAGLVILGKTNTPEFGILPTTESHLLGPCRNPWNVHHSTGGSSGGSAAAVAAGMVPMAHANDGGGSIRIPASCCGLFGMKPTRARTPLGPDVGDIMAGCAVEHALARSVRDSAGLLDATEGPDVGDPYWAPPKARPYVEEISTNPGRLHIAFTTEASTGVEVHEQCVQAVEACAKLCQTLGHEVVRDAPKLDGDLINQAFMVIYTVAGAAAGIDGFAVATGKVPKPEDFEPLTWASYEMGGQQTGSSYVLAVTALQRVSRYIAAFMLDYDVWLTPTLAEPPLTIGALESPPENPLCGLLRAAQYVPFTPLCNFTGQPAMSMPLHWTPEGLPVGVHFVGRFGDEGTLFRLAAQLEEAKPWRDQWPPMA